MSGSLVASPKPCWMSITLILMRHKPKLIKKGNKQEPTLAVVALHSYRVFVACLPEVTRHNRYAMPIAQHDVYGTPQIKIMHPSLNISDINLIARQDTKTQLFKTCIWAYSIKFNSKINPNFLNATHFYNLCNNTRNKMSTAVKLSWYANFDVALTRDSVSSSSATTLRYEKFTQHKQMPNLLWNLICNL